MLRPKMSLRVGYINVRGLTDANWKTCNQLLSTRFDFLFVAETWFMDHPIRSRDRRVIVSTLEPPANPRGRKRGGIYLLGTLHSRTKVREVMRTEHSITLHTGKHIISGVYFPPSLDLQTLQEQLSDLAASTILLGDINTRFRDPIHQHGEPGPLNRLEIWTEFIASADFEHLKPEQGAQKLTLDHCFFRRGSQRGLQVGLKLLSAAGTCGIHTDHDYAMLVDIGQPEQNNPIDKSIKRFRVSQLSKPHLKDAMLAIIAQADRPFAAGDDIENMNAKLIGFCQYIQETTIGRSRSIGQQAMHSIIPATTDQTYATSIKLYKYASRASKENDVILPTDEAQSRGMDAAAENVAIFRKRWSGTPFQIPLAQVGADEMVGFTIEEVVEEIRAQEQEKSCGADGIHIRFLKAVQETAVIVWLQQLFNHCLQQGRTPRAWNESDIYLLTKDVQQRRDAKNLRPISIICIFRKVFERLILLRSQNQFWATLHPS
ncbi:hypothetical protein N431DRAFT_310855, partial [Stipitochalara longipes BDJ]